MLRIRIGSEAPVQTLPWNKPLLLNGVQVSFHPAGHVLGSSQIRIEHKGEVWVVSGDYKLTPDRTCTAFEPVRCHTFITECTFGLPVFRWPDPSQVAAEINTWWKQNQAQGRSSLMYVYALGKAQRVLSLLDASIGPIGIHSSIEKLNEAYRSAGIPLPDCQKVLESNAAAFRDNGIVLAPASVEATSWERRLGQPSRSSASGWMAIRGNRRIKSLDRGFVLSDHGDWPQLMKAVSLTGASTVLATHGSTGPFIRYLNETAGIRAADLHLALTEAEA